MSLTIRQHAAPKFQGDNFYKNLAVVGEFRKVAAKKGATLAQVALAWVAAQGFISIPGTTKVHRLEQNWASRDIELTEEEKAELRSLIDKTKPHGARFSKQHAAAAEN
jgi:aryl-alcohol dehydrogenase-like predicted oxidoreductase